MSSVSNFNFETDDSTPVELCTYGLAEEVRETAVACIQGIPRMPCNHDCPEQICSALQEALVGIREACELITQE
jgi:hypothetical protein